MSSSLPERCLPELDWRTLPLQGRALIEASAGTGKTYNIALLHLRLILQARRSVREVLVCTFTDAAASELRERLRARLVQAEAYLRVLSNGVDAVDADDPLYAWLAELSTTNSPSALLLRARDALADLDLAPISTIHGFCRRLLSDFPFDSGSSFRPGEIADEEALIVECVEDWWRQRYQQAQIAALESAFILPLGPRGLARRVRALWRLRHAELRPPPMAELEAAMAELQSGPIREQLRQLSRSVESFAQKNSKLLRALSSLDAAIGSGDWSSVRWDVLEELDSPFARKQSSAKRKIDLSIHPLILWLIDKRPLLAQRERIVRNGIALRALDFLVENLPKRLAEREQLSFDSMIEQVHDGLQGEAGQALADRVFAALPAALIDEFQDTDLQQWRIFDRIYRDNTHPDSEDQQRGSLILIGDPKQSIYAFRGADVHAYLAARGQISERRSIRGNYRSSEALVGAINALYGQAKSAAFGGADIEYQAVSAAGAERLPTLRHRDAAIAQPLFLHQLPGGSDVVGRAEAMALERCADQLSDWLASGDYRLGDQPLQPGDFAVLLNTNAQLSQMRRLLLARGVPVVGSGRSDVFDTPWAKDLQVLLFALLHPGSESALRAALATQLLGWRAVDLVQLRDDAVAWEVQLERFAGWARLWRDHGVLALLQPLIAELAPRLLAQVDGERALTDLRHLAELLQQAAQDCYGAEALLAWLITVRNGGAAGDEAGADRQLRIESDGARVQLCTVHGAKGLEYNCVFVPLAWRVRGGRYVSDSARYHDAAHRVCVDLGSADFEDCIVKQQDEDLQERMRKLYVALTRARHACHLYIFEDLGHRGTRSHELSELGQLVGTALANTGADDSQQRWAELGRCIPQLAIDLEPPTPMTYQPPRLAAPSLGVRGELPATRPYRGLYSFSALTRSAGHPSDSEAQPGADDEPTQSLLLPVQESAGQTELSQLQLELPEPRLSALSGLRGPAFGDAVHQIFELRELDKPLAAQQQMVEQQLRAQGVLGPGAERSDDAVDASQTVSAVAELIQRALDTELSRGLSLGRLSSAQQRAEMEFCFVLERASLAAINQCLSRYGYVDLLPARPGNSLLGLMTGYIDLIFEFQGRFHVLDYKSNYLGEQTRDYQGEALDAAMAQHHYVLQALIYSVALHRYLRQRIAGYKIDKHLGDAWYLFVRGLGLAPGAGVWRRRFEPALIEALDQLFDGQRVAAA